jgi:Homing endonuclease associated repeat
MNRCSARSRPPRTELGAEFGHEEYKAISAARGWSSANAITARFGSWNQAREMAGLPVVRPLERGWTREQLIRALRAAARRLGGTPMARDWNGLAAQFGWPHSATVIRRVGGGSWERAIEEAGLARRPRSAWTSEQVIALLRADAYRRGRPPREHEWQARGAGHPSCHQVKRLFGSWSAALREANLETYRPAA